MMLGLLYAVSRLLRREESKRFGNCCMGVFTPLLMVSIPVLWFTFALGIIARGQSAKSSNEVETFENSGSLLKQKSLYDFDQICTICYALGWVFAVFGGTFTYLGVVLVPKKESF